MVRILLVVAMLVGCGGTDPNSEPPVPETCSSDARCCPVKFEGCAYAYECKEPIDLLSEMAGCTPPSDGALVACCKSPRTTY